MSQRSIRKRSPGIHSNRTRPCGASGIATVIVHSPTKAPSSRTPRSSQSSGRRAYLSRVELLAETDGAVATFTLNRPERLNAVTPRMIDELDAALAAALADDAVRVIRLRGAGRAFCAGYDLEWASAADARGATAGPWDPAADFRVMSRYVNSYMALWRSPKPVVAQVHGVCVGGGSDLALCSDLIVCAEDARIGYPPARVWGSPTTAMWFHRLGLERAKRLLLTGDPMSGTTAAEWGFASGAYPEEKLDAAAIALCERIARLPANQLQFMKMLVNGAVEAAGPRDDADARHAARRRRAPHARGQRVLARRRRGPARGRPRPRRAVRRLRLRVAHRHRPARVTGLTDSQLFDDYKIHVDALTSQYTRMWTRFNFFITIHSALLVALIGLFKEDVEPARSRYPALGLLMSVLWYVTGAQDRYMVGFYRAMITHAAERVAPGDRQWAHPGLGVRGALPIVGEDGLAPGLTGWRNEWVSVTRLPALVPLLIGVLWIAVGVVVALVA